MKAAGVGGFAKLATFRWAALERDNLGCAVGQSYI